jgi:hypothetical protein
MRPEPGTRVTHGVYGPGVVVLLRTMARAKVRFDAKRLLPLTVPLRELSLGEEMLTTGNGTVRPRSEPRPTPRARRTHSDIDLIPARVRIPDLRQAIEALRLGIVPRGFASDYTVGRDAAIGALDELLGNRGGLRLVWGDYGTGKTHLLEVFEQKALAEGFVTARITLDPQEVPPSHPQRLWRAIVSSLRHPDQTATGLDPLFDRLIGSEDHRSHKGGRSSRCLSPVLFTKGTGRADATDWVDDYAEGYRMDMVWGGRLLRRAGWKGPLPLSFPDFRTYGRFYIHLIGTLATWARDAGHRGLVLLFDEVEYVESVTGDSRQLAKEVLMHYAAATMDREDLQFDPERLYRGGRAVHRQLPLRYSDDQHLSVVMALTPLPEAEVIAGSILATRRYDLHLTPLTPKSYLRLGEKVAALYQRAYPECRLPPEKSGEIARATRDRAADLDWLPRDLVRAAVMALDEHRLRSGRV